jgi:Fuc2NAc and GlcNAc transferase
LRPLAEAWILGGGIVCVAGAVDDVRHLSAGIRIAAHTLAAVLVLAITGILEPRISGLSTLNLQLAGWLIGICAIVWYINLFNFMDGIDGIAAAQSLFVAGAGSAFIALQSAGAKTLQLPLITLAGAAAGFLLWNFPRARIFMGDGGSGFIGFSFAVVAYAIPSRVSISVWVWLLLNELFVVDATITLVTRLMRRERVYLAHRSHAYQRLARRWGSHCVVTLIYSAINIGWCLPWAIAAFRAPRWAPMCAAVSSIPLIILAIAVGAGRPDTAGSQNIVRATG